MCRKLDASGLEDMTELLAAFGQSWRPVAKESLYEGRKVMREELLRQIDALPVTGHDDYYPDFLRPLRAIRPTEKKGLKEGLRIFKMESGDDGVSVSISFDGYNDWHRPNILIARSLAKGSSMQQPNRFVSRAFSNAKNKSEKAIQDRVTAIVVKTFRP